MKTKIIIFIVLIIITFICNRNIAYCQNVQINDSRFKNYLLNNSNINVNGDNEIQFSEAENFTGEINIENLKINNIQGIEAFTNLTSFNCNCNILLSIDLSSNIALKELECVYTFISDLNLRKNINLEKLNCCINSIDSLDLSQNINLKFLNCNYNNLTSLDLKNNILLKELFCETNSLKNIDISNNIYLEQLWCLGNEISTLDLSNNNKLRGIVCKENILTNLELSNKPELTHIICSYNKIQYIDISGSNNITCIICNNNMLESLDLSECEVLGDLECFNNNLKNLNLKNGFSYQMCNFEAYNNPLLYCIQVDSVENAIRRWSDNVDSIANFSDDCNLIFENTLNIFPNPSNGYFIVHSLNKTIKSIEIYNNLGQKANSNIEMDNPFKYQINISDNQKGIYIIKINFEDKSYSKKGLII